SHHEQQASEHGDEQQHQELSPAYNRNPAPPQASTQGLFQQVRLVTPIEVRFTLTVQRPVNCSSLSGYRAPSTLIFEEALLMSRRSSAVSSTEAAPGFSSRR